MKKIALLLALMSAGLVQAQGAYRWVDQEGKVHYGDRPPPSAKEVQQKRLDALATDKQLPYATRQAMANFPVTLYVSPDCGAGCKDAAAFLRQRGVPFTQKSIEKDEDLAALKTLTGGEAVVPVLQVGTRVRKGYESGEWGRQLDAAGYPKAP